VLSLPVEQAAQTLWAGLHGIVAFDHSLFHDTSTDSLTLKLADGLLDSLVAGTPGDSWVIRPTVTETEASRQIRALLMDENSPKDDGKL
jgi:hypothetical protein